MKYKMIVADYDFTLSNKEKIVTPRTRNAITEFQKQGGKFVICTARQYGQSMKIASDLGLQDEIINNGGATIYHLGQNKLLYQNLLTNQDALDILKFFKNKTPHIFIGDDFKMYCRQRNLFTYICNKSVFCLEKAPHGLLATAEKLNLPQIIVGSYSPRRVKKFNLQAKDYFGERFEIGLCDKHLINICQQNVSKGKAIKIIGDQYKIKKEEIISFGDSENDKSMFNYSGVGVAMGNAMPELKNVATHVCDDVENDGLAKYIEANCL